MRKLFVCIISILCLSFLSGCWDSVEYENMAMISAIGIDYNKETDEFTVSLQKLSSFKGGTENSRESEPSVSNVGSVHSITGKTIYGAIEESQSVITKRLFFGCTETLMIGEDAAKYKLMDIIDLMDRTPSLRERVDIVVAENAEDTLSTVDYSKTTPSGIEISNLIKQSTNSGMSCPVSAQDFSEMLAIGGLEAVAPHVITSSNDNLEAKGGVLGNVSSYEERIGNNILAGTAVFKGDHFVGYLDERESQGYAWITGQKVHEIKTSLSSDNNSDFAYYYIKRAKSSISVKFDGDMPTVELKVSLIAELRKNPNNNEADIFLSEELKEFETMLDDSIRVDIEAALSKCQKEYKSDVFGFGFKLFRGNPKLWQEKYESKWDEYYPEIPVNIEIDSKIVDTGTNIRKFIVK
jgi:spore germination protein KC